MQTPSAAAISCATAVNVLIGTPVICSAYSIVNDSSDFLNSSNLFTHVWMKSIFARPLSMRYFAIAHSHTASVEGLGWKKMSARSAISCLRKSATISRCPRCLCDRFTRVASTGWFSAGFAPTINTRPAFSISAIEPASAPYPTVRCKPVLAGFWQYRAQLSTLLVPITARESFCIR